MSEPAISKSDSALFEFSMGEFVATFPRDRRYATNHMWALDAGASRTRFGLTTYAVRLLQDVYFLDWIVEPAATITLRQHIGSIESKKAESDLYAPVAGRLVRINDAVLADPSLINADPYGDGWMIEFETENRTVLIDPDGYAAHLVDAWDVAQRTIKGQANT